MSSETDQPRQRTVAELLAENGGAGATGRRRRRREADGPDDAAQPTDRPAGAGPPPGPPWPDRFPPPPPSTAAGRRYGPPPDADRTAGYRGAQGPASPTRGGDPLRGGGVTNGAPLNGVPNGSARNGASPNAASRNGAGPVSNGYARPAALGIPDGRPAPARAPEPGAPPEYPTEQMPRIREESGPSIDDATGPIARYSAEATTALPPRTVAASAPAAPWDTPSRDPGRDADGGPPTVLGGPPLVDDEDDADDEDWAPASAREAPIRRAEISYDGGPPTQAAPLGLDDYDDDEDWDAHPAGLAEDLKPDQEPQRRMDRAAAEREESNGSAWAAVIAQWIAGAIAGATLWVGFRYLWFNLPVVALAAAVLVTVGLVLGVRALLRNDDLRTTIFAVLVGLLLTVSPAILVLLGR